MLYSQNLQTDIAKFLKEEVLSLSMVDGRIAPDLDSYRTGNVLEKYAKETHMALYTTFAVYQNPCGPSQHGKNLHLASTQAMICAITKTTVYLLAVDDEAMSKSVYSRKLVLAEFDRQTTKIVDQHTTKKFGKTTFALQQRNIYAKIEFNLFSENYTQSVKMLRQNYLHAANSRSSITYTAKSAWIAVPEILTIIVKLIIINNN